MPKNQKKHLRRRPTQEHGETKKAAAKKATTKKSDTKKTTTKKSDTKKTVAKKTDIKKVGKKTPVKKSDTKKINILEYYDLPYRYNQTVVKILAQNPTTLFVYWDISDNDVQNFINTYGENFFNTTKPVLIIHNKTMNYTFELDINDFANCWYVNINDTNCEYSVELGRRPIPHNSNITTEYIYITSSNQIETPNDHILFENMPSSLAFKNIKTKNLSHKDYGSLSFIYMNKFHGIYELYKRLYKDEIDNNLNKTAISNPASISSSWFK